MQQSGIAQIWHLINVRECTGQMKSDFETEDTVMFRKIFQVVMDIYPLKRQPHKIVEHSNNSSATADEYFECVWPFNGINGQLHSTMSF